MAGGHYGDPPIESPSPTAGWRLNHSMLRIRDPVASLHFYIELMGMRTVFTLNSGPYTIYFLGCPSSENSHTIAHFVQSSLENMSQQSLLELCHVHGSEKIESGLYSNGNTPPHIGFGHLGFNVPDVAAALDRLSAGGAKVVKPLGVATRESAGLTDFEKQKGIGVEEFHEGYKKQFSQIGFVQDPDGYWIELVPSTLA